MDSKIITITIVDQNKPRQIKCLKVLSKEHYLKIKDKISLLKEGSIVYSARIFDQNNIGDNDILFISKTREVVKEIKDAKYVIESKKKIAAITVPIISINENDEKDVDKLLEAARTRNKKEFPKRVKVMESLIDKKIKDMPTPQTDDEIKEESDKIDETLLKVLENIKAKTVIKEEKAKADSEVEKLKLELMKAKLSLINKWIDANKEEIKE